MKLSKLSIAAFVVVNALLNGEDAEANGILTLRPASVCKVTGGTPRVYANDGWIGNGDNTTAATWECIVPVSGDSFTRIVEVYFFDDSTSNGSMTLRTKQLTGNTADTDTQQTTDANGFSVDDRVYRAKTLEAGSGGGNGEHALLTFTIPRFDSGEVAITGIRVIR